MVETNNGTNQDYLADGRARVLGTKRDNPEEGRIFIWTKMGWFERIPGPSGNAAFTRVAESELELHEYIYRDSPSFDLVPLSNEFSQRVFDQFVSQTPSYLSSPEDPGDNQPEDNQTYHQHD